MIVRNTCGISTLLCSSPLVWAHNLSATHRRISNRTISESFCCCCCGFRTQSSPMQRNYVMVLKNRVRSWNHNCHDTRNVDPQLCYAFRFRATALSSIFKRDDCHKFIGCVFLLRAQDTVACYTRALKLEFDKALALD